MKMSVLDRILLLLTGLLAAWQVAVGINDAEAFPILVYSISFGVLLVASLLLIILGFEVLDAPLVVIVSTIIPLSLSLGLIWEHLAAYRVPYLIFTLLGFLFILITRLIPMRSKLPVIAIAAVHGIAGMVIFLLPFLLAFSGRQPPGFCLVGIGGALIGLAGLLLSFLKTGHAILTRRTILRILPAILLSMTIAFVLGFHV
jgi:hypothetical protein